MANHFIRRSINATETVAFSGPSPVSNKIAIQHNEDGTSSLHSTLETVTSIETIVSLTTIYTTPSQTASVPPKAPTHAIESSAAPAPPRASNQGHVGNVGTVVSEADVPEEWGPKFLDVEKAQADRFMGYMVLVFAVTMIGIIGIGWWKGLWKSKVVRRAFVDRGHGTEG